MEASGLVAPIAVSGATMAAWCAGSAGPERPRRGTRSDRATSIAFALILGAGVLLAAGLADGAGFLGLPRSLWGLLLGVWLGPLVVTSLGFALAFEPPDPVVLKRLRGDSGKHA